MGHAHDLRVRSRRVEQPGDLMEQVLGSQLFAQRQQLGQGGVIQRDVHVRESVPLQGCRQVLALQRGGDAQLSQHAGKVGGCRGIVHAVKQDGGPSGCGNNGCRKTRMLRIVLFGIHRHVDHVEAGRSVDGSNVAARGRGERGQFRHAFQLDPHGQQEGPGLIGGRVAFDQILGGLFGFSPREVFGPPLSLSDFGDELVHQRRLWSVKLTMAFQWCRDGLRCFFGGMVTDEAHIRFYQESAIARIEDRRPAERATCSGCTRCWDSVGHGARCRARHAF